MRKPGMLEKYFYPMVNQNEIFRTADAYGTIIVYEFRKFRIMTFDSLCEQSKVRMGDPLYLDHEYSQAMLLPLLQLHPQHITLLGLGAGSLASCLYHIYSDATLVAVEWRQAVIDIAYRYFELPEDKRLQVTHREALSWLEDAQDQSTDLILSDLYHASSVNEVQMEKRFFENCHRVLSEKGWLSLNYHVMPSAESLAINWLCKLFPTVFMLQLNTSNWVVVAGKQEISLPAMMSADPNLYLPVTLSVNLRLLQGRLIRVNRKNRSKK